MEATIHNGRVWCDIGKHWVSSRHMAATVPDKHGMPRPVCISCLAAGGNIAQKQTITASASYIKARNLRRERGPSSCVFVVVKGKRKPRLFQSVTAAAESLGMGREHLSAILRGKANANGFRAWYAEGGQ
jgi:hypothetical protein